MTMILTSMNTIMKVTLLVMANPQIDNNTNNKEYRSRDKILHTRNRHIRHLSGIFRWLYVDISNGLSLSVVSSKGLSHFQWILLEVYNAHPLELSN